MDHSLTTRLPVELWIIVIIILRDKFPCKHGPFSLEDDPCVVDCPASDNRNILPLSYTCHFFHDIAQPLIYESITINWSLNQWKPPAGNGLNSMLLHRKDLQSFVRRLTLINVSAATDELLSTFLPLLVEVRHVSLMKGVNETAITLLLHNSAHLQTLTFQDSHLSTNFPWDQPWGLGRQTEELMRGFIGLASEYGTVRLQVSRNDPLTPTMTHLRTNWYKLTRSPHFYLPLIASLINLSTSCASNANLLGYLSHCPLLEVLEVRGGGARGEGGVASVDPHLLPRLRAISWSPSTTLALSAGRPIRSISTPSSLTLFSTPLPELETLCLTSLSKWDGGLAVMDAMLACCPGLVKLDIRSEEESSVQNMKTWIETRARSDVAALPKLQVLHLKWKSTPPNEFIEGWQAKIPGTDIVSWAATSALIRESETTEEMLVAREMVIGMKNEHCPDLRDVWLEPQYAWTYFSAGDAWLPNCRFFRTSSFGQ